MLLALNSPLFPSHSTAKTIQPYHPSIYFELGSILARVARALETAAPVMHAV